jgi:hypothetical protein
LDFHLRLSSTLSCHTDSEAEGGCANARENGRDASAPEKASPVSATAGQRSPRFRIARSTPMISKREMNGSAVRLSTGWKIWKPNRMSGGMHTWRRAEIPGDHQEAGMRARGHLERSGRGSGPLSHRQHRRAERPIAEDRDLTMINFIQYGMQ